MTKNIWRRKKQNNKKKNLAGLNSELNDIKEDIGKTKN